MQRTASIGILGIILVFAIIGIYGSGSLPSLDLGESEKTVIFDIDTEEEWMQHSGIGWSEDAVKFDDDRLRIDEYGHTSFPDSLSTHVIHRTELNDVSQDVDRLETLNVKGFVSENHTAVLGIAVIDCSSSRAAGNDQRVRQSCNSAYEVYNTERIDEPGKVNLTEDISDVEVDGNIVIHTNLAIDEEEPVSEDQEPYIESVKLTGR